MKNQDLVVFCLNWLQMNSALIVQLLQVLLPFAALAVVGYALYKLAPGKGRK
ncbi:MAG TPA: hypothetical protein VN782_15835 [Usitatibacter sp.]|nr:hypothetical protein [Usitatibacter sp.]